MITLVQLEYIVAVDTFRHFATAAEKCFVTQPTLSMQVKKLESDLGIKIFDRSKQPVIPTDVGKQVVEQARNILRDVQRINDTVQQHKKTITGNLKIGIIPTLAPYLLPLFIGKIARNKPELHLHVQEMVTEKIIDLLKKDVLDVGILVTPLNEPGITEDPMFYEEIKIYTNPKHSFAKQNRIKLEDIYSPDIWLLNQGHCFRHQVINLCSYQNTQKSSLPFEYESGSIETLKKIVDKEGGFTLMPELALQDLSPKRKECVKSFHKINPIREVSLAYTRNFVKRRVIGFLKEQIQKSIPEKMLNSDRGTVVEWK